MRGAFARYGSGCRPTLRLRDEQWRLGPCERIGSGDQNPRLCIASADGRRDIDDIGARFGR